MNAQIHRAVLAWSSLLEEHGVRLACVLKARMFARVLQFSMAGIDLAQEAALAIWYFGYAVLCITIHVGLYRCKCKAVPRVCILVLCPPFDSCLHLAGPKHSKMATGTLITSRLQRCARCGVSCLTTRKCARMSFVKQKRSRRCSTRKIAQAVKKTA